MNQIPPITDAELEIMRVLWANPDCPSSEVVKKMTDLMGWSPNTTRTLLSRLVQKRGCETGKGFKAHPTILSDHQRAGVSAVRNQILHEKLYGEL